MTHGLVLRWLLGVLFAAALCIVTSPAAAQAPDFQARSAARKLGAEGLKLYQQKDYAGALDKFDRANTLVPAPTLAIRAARCLVELGRLVEASDRYLEVTRMELPVTSRWVHKKAQLEAGKEREALLPRIPNLVIHVEGEFERVEIDGEAVPEALIGASRPTDPGEHTVVAFRDEQQAEAKVTLEESETKELTVTMPPPPPPPEPPPPPPPPPSNFWQHARWTALGIGAGGLVAGVSHGAIALAREGSLEDECPNRTCPPDSHGAADFYDGLRVGATVGFVLAAVGLTAGAAIWIVGPDDEGPDDARVDPGIRVRAFAGLQGAGLAGTF